MMRRKPICLASLALTSLVSLSASNTTFAQNSETAAGSASRARSTNERVGTESTTPPPVNSDYRRAAEGTLPNIPGASPVGGAAIDPAARGPLTAGAVGPNGAVGVPGAAGAMTRGMGMPAGLDAAMLIEHAVEMGIGSSILGTIAMDSKPDEAGNDAVKALKMHADDDMKASKNLLTKAAAVGNNLPGDSPVRGFYHAASNYMNALEKLSEPGLMAAPNNKAEMAEVNHAVKAMMEASHISQFAGMGGGSPAMSELLNHAKTMKDEGNKTLDRIGGTNPIDPSAPISAVLLAQRGRDLITAADRLAPMASQMYTGGGVGGNPLNAGQYNNQLLNPGRVQNNAPEIVGGTYGTGSQTAGTATGAEAARNVKNSTEGPNGVLNVPTPGPGSGVSGYGVGNNNTPPTNSTAGSRPR